MDDKQRRDKQITKSHPRLMMKSIIVPKKMDAPDVWDKIIICQLIYSLAGLVLGLVCIIGGIVLFFNNITGSTSWVAKIIGLNSSVTNAAPGAVLFIVGLFIVYITKFDVKVMK